MSKSRIDIMGIVNLTDDSFYAPSRCASLDADGLRRVISGMLEDGATMIDLGACSMRPGSVPISADEEWHRLEPVLNLCASEFPDVRISIDTFRSVIVERAHAILGHFTVNDISAGEDDPKMLPAVGRLGLGYIAMHKRGNPLTMQQMTDYGDVVEEVMQYFRDFELRAQDSGIADYAIDPGFGFAKTLEQNYALMAGLGRFKALGRRILVGISRKSMIYKPLGITPEEALTATEALHMVALSHGADILRTHSPLHTARTVRLWEMLQ